MRGDQILMNLSIQTLRRAILDASYRTPYARSKNERSH